MASSIVIKQGKKSLFSIDRVVFELLFNHTIVRRHASLAEALELGFMKYDRFINLTRKAEVPFPLFTADIKYVKEVIRSYEKIVFFGVCKENISLATRGDIALADISLIIKDITRKQSFLKGQIDSKNIIPGLLKKTAGNLTEQSNKLRDTIKFRQEEVFLHNTKEKSFNYLLNLLADQHVYISIYTHNQCPQSIEKSLNFSGIAIKDKKCPYLFIKAGDEDSAIEPWGRRIFTATLLLVCLALGKNGPVSMDGRATELIPDLAYRITEEILMPGNLICQEDFSSLDDIRQVSDKYALSPSAIVMRCYRLGVIDETTKNAYLSTLFDEFNVAIKNRGGGRGLTLEKAVTRYNNPRLVHEVLLQCASGAISERDAKHLLYYKKGQIFDSSALGSYI